MSAVGEVWIVSTLLPEQGKDAWEINGVYTTLDAALAACTDGRSAAVRMTLNADYRGVYEFWHATPARPEPFLVNEGAPDAPLP